MPFDYGKLQGVASGLFEQFDQGVLEYGVTSKGSGPAFNPGESATVWTKFNGVARGVSTKYVMQGLAVGSDLQVNCGVFLGGIEPQASWLIRLDGSKIYSVVQVIRKPAVGVVIAYNIVIRIGG